MPPYRVAATVLTLAAALASARVRAETPFSAHIVGYGETSVSNEAGTRDPSTVEGIGTVRLWQGARIVRQATRIEARPCLRFGILFTVAGLKAAESMDVTIRSSHPPLSRPDGQTDTGVKYSTTVTGGRASLAGYSFNHSWELVPGAWTFTVEIAGKASAEQSFEVVLPKESGEARWDGCAAALS